MARAPVLKVTGTVERNPPIFWDDRGIGLLKLVEHEKPIRIKELQRPELPKDLKQGDKITAEINEDDRYCSLISLERERAASQTVPQTGSITAPDVTQAPLAEQPPKTELVVSLKEKLDEIDSRVANQVLADLVESLLKIEVGMWEKGSVISEWVAAK